MLKQHKTDRSVAITSRRATRNLVMGYGCLQGGVPRICAGEWNQNFSGMAEQFSRPATSIAAQLLEIFMYVQQNSTGFKTFTDWFSANVDDDDCNDIREHGVFNSPPRGLYYHGETAPLYEAFSDEIWDIVLQGGDITIQEHIAGQDFRGCATYFATFMVWSAVEKLAFERLYGQENEQLCETLDQAVE